MSPQYGNLCSNVYLYNPKVWKKIVNEILFFSKNGTIVFVDLRTLFVRFPDHINDEWFLSRTHDWIVHGPS